MIVNLTKMGSDIATLFDSNKKEVLLDYQKLTDALLRRSNELSWFINNVTSRNTNFSRLFYYMRCQKLLDELSKKHEIEEVITEDFLLAKLIKKSYNVKFNGIHGRKPLFADIFRCIIWSICALFCKSKDRLTRLEQSHGATIIDTDIAKKADKYNDRYYGDVLDTLSKGITKDFFYNIIYLPYPRRKDIALIDKNTPYNTVYLWDFLKPVDYVKSFYRMIKMVKGVGLNYDYLGINQRPVLESVYKDSISFYYFAAFLYERVIYRMKGSGIQIRLYVDWFENQSIDKSFHWAMNMYYPETEVHSYIGFMADTTENPITIASNTELDLNIAPNHVFLCNKDLLDQYAKSGYKGQISIAPFYRAQAIWNVSRSKEVNDFFTILVPLGLNRNEVEFKSQFFASILKSPISEKIRILIKPHPVYDANSIRQLIDGCEGISIVEGNIYDYLSTSDAVVASNSTTTYEALALGIPLLYVDDSLFRFSLNRPNGVQDLMWNKVSDFDSLIITVQRIKKTDKQELQKEGEKLRDYYFTNQTLALTNQLFCLQ